MGKKRRLDSGDGYDTALGSQTAIRVSTSAIGSVEFSADQDGTGKWVKLSNVGKEVRIPPLFWDCSISSKCLIFLPTIIKGCQYWKLDLETQIRW